MKRWAKFTCLMLAMLLVLTALPTFAAVPAAAAETDAEDAQKAYTDYVLLLDCSASLIFNDPKDLCMVACKRFIDTLPIQNARVSVIAFGYQGDAFPYEAYAAELELKEDVNFVHEIVPMDVLDTTEKKNDCKRIMENTITNSRKNGATTPIGHALLAAVEVLQRNNSTSGDACIILVTDGINEPSTINQDPKLVEFASQKAGEKGWPIYSVHLAPTKASEEARENNYADPVKLLDGISKNSGDRAVGRVGCETPDDVNAAFKTINNDFNGKDQKEAEEITLDDAGYGEYAFEVNELTSELTIDITGENISKVELIYQEDDGKVTTSTYSESEDLGHRIVVKEQYYFMIKMVVPKAGKWKIGIHGDENAKAEIYTDDDQEMELNMVATPSSKAAILNRNDTIKVRAVFEYRNMATPDTGFYSANPATLNVLSADQKTVIKSYPSDSAKTDENGYYWDLKLGDVPGGDFHLQAVLEHSLFRGGKKASNTAAFSMENLPVICIENGARTLNGYVNGQFEKIDLSTIFENPDNDPVAYELICDDRDVKFTNSVSEDGYMTIDAGLVPGTYEMSITAKDADMAAPVVYDQLTLVVENRDPVIKEEIAEQELWLDHYSFQEPGVLELNLDLNGYFADPDGMPLTYSVAVSADNVVQAQVSDNVLQVIPAMEEEVIVTVTASDGLSEMKQEFTVEVVSGKGIFWAENWIWFALAVGAIVLIIIIIVSISKLTRAKGKWSVSFEENGYLEDIGQLNLNTLPVCRKQKVFKLKDMIMQIGNFAAANSDVITHIPSYFGNPGAAKLEVKGVPFGSGFVLNKIPDGDAVQVDYNGRTVRKSVRVSGGTLRVVLTVQTPYGGEDKLVITMRSN